jgi:Helicase C-terminal domain
LFNVNPIIQPSTLLVFDDAHGGEHFVSDMWTVNILSDDAEIYGETLTILRPAITDSQYQMITDDSQYGAVELIDLRQYPEVVDALRQHLDAQRKHANIYFPWIKVRNYLHACLVLASVNEIVIRPVNPPTHTHRPFNDSKQRIYMSATLGGEGDLLRSYGLTSIKTIRAQHPQWGKRYIFVPGLYMEDDETTDFVAEVWNAMKTKRGLLLAPSFKIAQKTSSAIASKITPAPMVLHADDIEDTIESFTSKNNSLLSLAGRYDGLDLPGDDCRLLIMAETPGAISTLERHQRDRWKLGPVLRRRERTRLIQGMGRCTRDATDYAVIILLGQTLVNNITTPSVVEHYPGEIQREINWGIDQTEVVRKKKESLTEMVLGLLDDRDYRREANESIEETAIPATVPDSELFDKTSKLEVQFGRVLWEGNFSKALEFAREAIDGLTDDTLGGYRAWWHFLGSIAAHQLKEIDVEIDHLTRARAIGVYTGFLDELLRKRVDQDRKASPGSPLDRQLENIWRVIDQWGWSGPKFGTNLRTMTEALVKLGDSTQYHIGLELLGQSLGAETLRSTEPGAPDGVWIFSQQCFTFEAKADKDERGKLYKKELQQAKGHPDWLRNERHSLTDIPIQPMVIAPAKTLDSAAEPHAKDLYYLSPKQVSDFAQDVSTELSKIRTEFAGKEFAAVVAQLRKRLMRSVLHLDSIQARFKTPLRTK